MLKIEQLLLEGDTAAADALIAAGLLARPSDPALTRLRARTLLKQGRLEEADRLIAAAIDLRPHHAGAVVLAGRIARRRGEHARAVDLLQRAIDLRPHEESLRRRMVQWQLDAGHPQRAEEALARLTWPEPLLAARVLRARGRLLEAADLLERTISGAAGPASRDRERAELVEVLEEIGNPDALRRAIDQLDDRSPGALLCAARAMLPLGSFGRAAHAAARLARMAPWRRPALPVLMVAATLDGHAQTSRRVLEMLRSGPRRPDVRTLVDAWRRGLLGATLGSQRSANRAGADPSRSVLQPLLQEALRVIETAPVGSARDRADLRRHRADCLAAMGRTLEAAACWARADADEPWPPAARIGPESPSRREAA
jgi:tetratricopeptide (TPR) repeat protein